MNFRYSYLYKAKKSYPKLKMFKKIIETDFIKVMEKDAKKYINQDRVQYRSVINTIIKFCSNSENNLIISDIDLLLSKKDEIDFVLMYAIEPEYISKTLTKDLCKQYGNKFSLKISEWDSNFMIEYNLRRICEISKLKIKKKYSVTDFITPVIYNLDGNNIQLMPPLLELITLYSELYNPLYAELWQTKLETIQYIEQIFSTSMKDLFSDLKNKTYTQLAVSDNFDQKGEIQNKENLQKKGKKESKKATNLITFVSDSEYILISDSAYSLYIDDVQKNTKVVTIIIQNDINLVISNLNNYLNTQVIVKEQLLYIPKETMLKKYSVYIAHNNGKNVLYQHIMDIYNSMCFELINISIISNKFGNFKVADYTTAIKFCYIDIYTNIIKHRITTSKYNELIAYISDRVEMIEFYKKKINITDKKINYFGHYVDSLVNKKKISLTMMNKNKSNFYCYELL